MIKIAIVGPESSGKSTLAKSLGEYFNTEYVKEVARNYLQKRDGFYTESDLIFMAKLQLEEEESLMDKANQILFCDTNLLNFLIWSEVKYGNVNDQLKKLWNPEDYDLHLVCFPDIPYESDELREHPSQSDREWLFRLHEKKLIEYGSNFSVVTGIGPERSKKAIEMILKTFPFIGWQ